MSVNPFESMQRGLAKEHFDRNPYARQHIQKLLMAAADMQKYAASPEKKGWFSSRTRLDIAQVNFTECLQKCIDSYSSMSMSYQHSVDMLESDLSLARSVWPNWSDAYDYLSKLILTLKKKDSAT